MSLPWPDHEETTHTYHQSEVRPKQEEQRPRKLTDSIVKDGLILNKNLQHVSRAASILQSEGEARRDEKWQLSKFPFLHPSDLPLESCWNNFLKKSLYRHILGYKSWQYLLTFFRAHSLIICQYGFYHGISYHTMVAPIHLLYAPNNFDSVILKVYIQSN